MNKLPEFENILGIVGGAGSGKDTVAEIFQRNGFSYISSSDLVREEISRRGLTTSRTLQTQVANELRQDKGVGYWVDLSLQKSDTASRNVVISGLYSPGEGLYVTNELSGKIVAVVTDDEDEVRVRFDRVTRRKSGARDALSFDEFMQANNRENSGVYEHETNLKRLIGQASFIIYNTRDLDYLKQQTLAIINEVKGE